MTSGKSPKSLNQLLKQLREDRGISQAQWGKAAGVDQGQVSRWEKGKGEPSIENLRGIADHLGITVAALIGDEQPAYAAPGKPKPEEMALHILEALLPPGAKRSLIKLALEMDQPHAEALLGVAEKSLSAGDNEAKLTGKCGSD